MNKIDINYSKLIADIRRIIAGGTSNLQEALRRQTLQINWKVSRYLNQHLPFDDKPSAHNAQIIKRLVKEFDRPETYFYKLIKFSKQYP